MKKKVGSWLLTVASYMFIIFDLLFVGGGGLIYNLIVSGFDGKNISIVFLIIYLIVFALSVTCGVFARKLAKAKTVPYYLAFPFPVLYLLKCLLIVIMFFVEEIKKNCGQNKVANQENASVFIVYDDGLKRTLTLYDKYCTDYEAPDSADYGAHYSKYRDDTGRFWRSYDGNKTFIRESVLREKGWRISW